MISALLAGLLALPAAAAPLEVAVDPRFELLGVVRRLVGAAPDVRDEGYAKEVDARFAPWKDHPAVALVRELASTPAGEESIATLPIYYTDPPALALRDPEADIHYLGAPGAKEKVQRLLRELRGFARDSRFGDFFAEHAAFYRRMEEASRDGLGGGDPVAEIEALVGARLPCRFRHVAALLGKGSRSFIVPYPLPPASLGAETFEVWTISAEAPSRLYASRWHEALFLFVDPSFHYFEKYNRIDPAAFYGRDVAACRAVSPECTKEWVVAVLLERLARAAGRPPSPPGHAEPSEREARYVAALSRRFDEYEKDRARWPNLWTFYPQLFSVFHELAHGGKPADLKVPAEPAIRSAADFFVPANVKRLTP